MHTNTKNQRPLNAGVATDATLLASGILSVVGDTPMIQLRRLYGTEKFTLFAKLEMLNPGGSVKDRTALNMIKRAWERGEIGPDTVIVESTSGNLGVGLAQVCRFLGLKLICVVDAHTTKQNIKILKTYGATVDVVEKPDPVTGQFLPARINRVKELLTTIPNCFWTNQYANRDNAEAHQRTMFEIVSQLGSTPDYIFCATSTCGTLRGCHEYIQKNRLKTQIVAVDAQGSVIFGGVRAKRLIPGHGAASIPALYQKGLENAVIHMSDLDCVVGCRRLLQHEAILAGGSTGAVISAIGRYIENLSREAVCAAILCDSGERYLDTIYCDEWVREHFGDVFHFWEE